MAALYVHVIVIGSFPSQTFSNAENTSMPRVIYASQ